MALFFKSVDDVAARVRSEPTGNGKAMLMLEIVMGVYDAPSKALAERWIAMDDAREAKEEQWRREAWERDMQARATAAAETQAREAIKATRLSRFALGVSIVGIVIAVIALMKP